MEVVVIVAWILCGIISAVSASNNGRCTLPEFFIFLLLGPLASARKPKHERHREMLEQFHTQRSKLIRPLSGLLMGESNKWR